MDRTRLIETSFILLFVINNWTIAEPFVCPGGLYAPNQKAIQANSPITRWGTRDVSGNFTPHTVVTFSFIEKAFTEDEDGQNNNIIEVTVTPIINSSGKFPANARGLIRNAFLSWTILADITFIEVTESEEIGDIRIGAHSFADPNVLAHGFFPPIDGVSGEGIVGDLHFNIEEDWTDQSGLLFAVALHEIGHTIGLDHIIDTGEIEDIIMYAVIGNNAGPPTIYDQAYIQDVYGPPIPKIIAATSNTQDGREIAWTYPFNPFDPATFDSTTINPDNPENPRVPAYELGFIRCPAPECEVDSNSAANDIRITNVEPHALNAFEIQSVPLVLTTFTDNAEDSQNKLFNDAIGDNPDQGRVNWEVTNDRSSETTEDSAYQVNPIRNVLSPAPLPLIERVIATPTSEWRFERSYIASIDQRIDYRILDIDGNLLRGFSEFGDDLNNPFRPLDVSYTTEPINPPLGQLPDYVSFENEKFIVDLSTLADQEIFVEYSLTSEATFENEAIFIDNIDLKDVLARDGEFTSASSSIEASATSFKVDTLPPGNYDVRLRALYQDFPETIFTRPVDRALDDRFKLTFTPTNDSMNSIVLIFGRNEFATNNNDDELLDVEIPDEEAAVIYFANNESQSGPDKLINDFRPLANLTRWRVEFSPGEEGILGELTWDTSLVRPDFLLFLQELEGKSPVGAAIDLINSTPETLPISLSLTTSFEILYGIPQKINSLQLNPGWNLLSTPVISLQTLESIFDDIKTGAAWFWNGKQFEIAQGDKPLNAERGYWVNSELGGSTQLIFGLFTDGLIQLQSHWNLVGPVGSQTSPQNVTTVMEWNSEQQHFQRPAEGMLNRGQAYWIYSKAETTIELGE